MSTQITPISKAVIPVAGIGTRFLPVTKSVPKALLPIFDKPLIQYVVTEAVQAGITQIAIVYGPGMEIVIDYFRSNKSLEHELKQKGKTELANQLEQIADLAKITGIYQDKPLGLGHAVSLAHEWVADEPFAVLLPDDLLWNQPSAIKQLLNAYASYGGQVLAGIKVSKDKITQKGIINIKREVDAKLNLLQIEAVVEKPKLEEAPSDISILGRYILDPFIFEVLRQTNPGAIGEIQITDAIQKVSERVPLYTVLVQGTYTDAGNPTGMLEAILEFAKSDEQLKNVAIKALRELQ